MSEAQIYSQGKLEKNVSPQTFALPREKIVERTINDPRPEFKNVVELRTNIGKRIIIESPLVRITPNPQGFCSVEAFNNGVWSPILTTPYYFDLQSREAR